MSPPRTAEISSASPGASMLVGPDGTAGTFFTTTGASLDQFDGKLETGPQPPRELLRAGRHGMRRSIRVRRQADDEQRRPPFTDQ